MFVHSALQAAPLVLGFSSIMLSREANWHYFLRATSNVMDISSYPYENICLSFAKTLSLSLPSCISVGASFPCVELGVSALLVL